MKFIVLMIVIFALTLVSCKSEPADDNEVSDFAEKLLDSFVSQDFYFHYSCRSQQFKDSITFDAYKKSYEAIQKIFPIVDANIVEVKVREDVALVKYVYQLDRLHSKSTDTLVVRNVGSGFECVELGMDQYFPFNRRSVD